jgi:hypothetical protein
MYLMRKSKTYKVKRYTEYGKESLGFFKDGERIQYPGIEAAKLLGLDNNGDQLFYLWEWPNKYRDMYEDAKSSRGRARATYKYIHSLVKKYQESWV